MPRGRRLLLWVLFWAVVAAAYVWGGLQQKERVNLSATAGGQYPYLVYARGIAQEGPAGYVGDRNRMPLYPILLATVHDEDWDAFVHRSSRFAIVSSLLILAGIGVMVYRTLPAWPATALLLVATFGVFIHKASFVQAELLYYGLLFACWMLLCRLILRPDPRWAALAGVLSGVTYLTKASALVTPVVFALVALVQASTLALRRNRDGVAWEEEPGRPSAGRVLGSAGIVVVLFLVTTYPYLSANKARFGRYFYDVNSRFFMWCDSWAEAKAFADEYRISEGYPPAPPDEIPGPVNYRKSHTPEQIGQRLLYGFRTLGGLAIENSCTKYLAVAVAFCLVMGLQQRGRLRELSVAAWLTVVFCVLFFSVYLVSYAWYAPIAYGDRFMLSLFLPAMFAALWLGHRLAQESRGVPLFRYRVRKSDGLAVVLVAWACVEGVRIVGISLYRPSEPYVVFYFNESHELLTAGEFDEAARGFRGVIRLDPSFSPAYRDLSMLALREGRPEDAIEPLREAIRLRPLDPDLQNSLGSALLQTGRSDEAVQAFSQATRLDPNFTSAWYNLGVAAHQRGERERLNHAISQLEKLEPRLADQLSRLAGT